MAVEVGLVEGITAQTTPNGSAISMTFLSSMRLTTPTVFIGLMKSYTCLDENRFFWTLSATTPNPVSSTASRASASACGVTAAAIASTIPSICACEYSPSIACAALARRARVRASAMDARSLSVCVDGAVAGIRQALKPSGPQALRLLEGSAPLRYADEE